MSRCNAKPFAGDPCPYCRGLAYRAKEKTIVKRTAILLFLGMLPILAGCNFGGSGERIAVVNMHDMVTKCTIGIRAMQEIQEQFAERRLALKQREESIRQLEAVLRVDPSLEKQSQMQRLLQEYGATNQQLLRDEAAARAAKLQPVVDQINRIVAAYAKEKGLSGIQDSKSFVYAEPRLDVTDEILRRLNAAL